jgi:hypothetical protein
MHRLRAGASPSPVSQDIQGAGLELRLKGETETPCSDIVRYGTCAPLSARAHALHRFRSVPTWPDLRELLASSRRLSRGASESDNI